MTCINAGEVYYMTCRKESLAKADVVWKALQQFPIHITDVDMAFSFKAKSMET